MTPLTVMIDARAANSGVGGIGRYTQRLIDAMLLADTDLKILALTPDPAKLREQLEDSGRVSMIRCDTEKAADLAGLHEHASKAGVCVYHGPSFFLPSALPAPGVVTIHDLAFLHEPRWYPRGFADHLSRVTGEALERSAQVIAVSDNVRSELIQRYPSAKGKISRIYEAPAIPMGDPAVNRLPEGLEPQGYLLAVGVQQRRKNAVGLVQAFAQLKSSHSIATKLVLVGGLACEDPTLPGMIREAGLESSVVLLGPVEDDTLDALYRSARLLVHFSFEEGFGLPPLEAMARGIPTVASDGGALAEILSDGACIVPAGHIPSLIKAIDRLLKNDEERRELARRGEIRARAFSWERTARETLAIYRRAAERTGTITPRNGNSSRPDASARAALRIGVDARFFNFLHTGTGRYTREILRALFSTPRQAEFVLIGPESLEEGAFRGATGLIQHIPAGNETLLDPAWEQFSLPSLLAGCDLFFSPTGILPLARPCKGAAVIHGLSFFDRPADFPADLHAYLHKWVRTTCISADLLIAVSAFTKGTIERAYRVPSARIRVIHHGRPQKGSLDPRPRAPGPTSRRPFLLFVGSLEPNKEVPHLVDAFEAIAPDWPGDLALAVRPGRDLDRIKTRILEPRLSGRVRLILNPSDDDLAELYGSASLYVSSACYESFGLPLVEAMTFGLPIVARAMTAMPEVVGDAGLLVDDASPQALGKAILDLLSDSARREELATAARARASCFSWEKAANETWTALLECMEAP